MTNIVRIVKGKNRKTNGRNLMHDFGTFVKNLPSPVRHFAGIVLGTAAAFFLGKIVEAGTIYGVDYATAALQAIDAGVLAGIGALLVLYITPLTNAYGVGKEDEEADDFDYGNQEDQLPDPAELANPDWASEEDWGGQK